MCNCKLLFFRIFCILLALILILPAGNVFAVHETLPDPLETPTTHWDEGSVWKTEGNGVIDTRDNRIQSVSQLFEGPYPGKPEEAARAFLKAHPDWAGIADENLRMVRTAESPGGVHITFERYINDVPVYPGNLVVSFDKDMYALFYFSSLYLFEDEVITLPALSSNDAKQAAINYLAPQSEATFGPESDLVVWAGDNRDFALCWRVLVNYTEPYGDWEILVDANNGQIRRVKNKMAAVNGTGFVFDPDPITTSGNPYGSPGLSDNNDANSAQLTAQRFNRTLLDISTFSIFGNDYYFLSGPYCVIDDLEEPSIAPVVQVNNTAFNYLRADDAFEDVVVYYHIDKSQRWMQSLGFNSIQNAPLPCDPHAENFSCNAHYHPSGNYLTFGQGPGAVDADAGEDAEVVLHEYGHAINNAITPGWGGGDEDRLGEGWGDYWAGSYGRSQAAYQSQWIVSWALQPCFGGRPLNAGLHYPEDNTGVHYGGQIWSQALYDAEVNMGSRTVMNRISLQSYYYYGTGASMLTAANAVYTADQNLYGSTHTTAITNSFVPRGLADPPNNDACPGFLIFNQPYVSSGTTAGAANNYTNCVGPTSQDVVYTLMTAQCPRNVTVSLCGSSYDTGLGIRTGGACPGTTPVACNDDFAGCGLSSQVTFVADGNTVYYIIVHGYQNNSGNFNISVTWNNVEPIPPNDACVGALAINSLPYSHASTTCGANNNYSDCIGASSVEVVYSLTLPTCETVTVSLCGSSYDTAIEIRSGGTCPGTQTIACNDDYCGLSSQVTFIASATQTYYLFVHGYCTECRGAYTLNVTTSGAYVAPNDECPGTTIAGLPYTDNGSTRCASNDFANCIGINSNDVVYNYTSPICQLVTASLCGSTYDCAIEVRAGGACPGVARVNCNDDAICNGIGTLQSQLTYLAEAGVIYYFIVHGYTTNAGLYTINVTGTPGGTRPNDQCTGAYAITTLPYVDVGSTICANNDRANCVGSTSREVFYSLQLESCASVTVSLCGSGYDAALELRTGGFDCPGTVFLQCNDDFCGLQSQLSFTALEGRPYWIIVHGYTTNSGPFILNVTGATCAPDSLVIVRQINDMYLDWAPVDSEDPVTYRVYRSMTSDVQPIAGNLIATTTNPFYSDINVVNNPQDKFFYVVTAEGNLILDQFDSDEAVVELAVEKPMSRMDEEAMQNSFIPAYINPVWIEGANPNKPTTEEQIENQTNVWFGTLAPLPENRQVKQ